MSSASLAMSRPRSVAVSLPQSPTSARSAASTAASISALSPRAISPISTPRDGSSIGRRRPDCGSTQRPSMKHLSESNQVGFALVRTRSSIFLNPFALVDGLCPAPHLFGNFDEPRQLDPLIGFAEVVAVRRRRKPALMAQCALLERHVFRGLLNAALDVVLGLGSGLLRAHEPEHDGRALRSKTQRGEIAGALVVIFQEEAVDLHLVEQDLRDWLVAALRDPSALEIPTTEMDADSHVGRPVANGIVDEPAIEADERVRVVAARLGSRANFGIAEISKIGVV